KTGYRVVVQSLQHFYVQILCRRENVVIRLIGGYRRYAKRSLQVLQIIVVTLLARTGASAQRIVVPAYKRKLRAAGHGSRGVPVVVAASRFRRVIDSDGIVKTL